MASAKKQYIESARKKYFESSKKRVKEKLGSIQEQAEIILSYVNDYVNGIVKKAEETSDELLAITNKNQFLEKIIPGMNQLEDYYHQLSLLNASLLDADGVGGIPDEDSEEDSDEDDGDDDTAGGSTGNIQDYMGGDVTRESSKSRGDSQSKDESRGSSNNEKSRESSIKKEVSTMEEVAEKEKSSKEMKKTEKKKEKDQVKSVKKDEDTGASQQRQSSRSDDVAPKTPERGEKVPAESPKKSSKEVEDCEKSTLKSSKSNSGSSQRLASTPERRADLNASGATPATVPKTPAPVPASPVTVPPSPNIRELPPNPAMWQMQMLMNNQMAANALAQMQAANAANVQSIQQQQLLQNVFQNQMPTSQVPRVVVNPGVSQQAPVMDSSGAFKLPLTKENVAKVATTKVMEEAARDSARPAGSVHSENEGLRVQESCDASITETGSSEVNSDSKKNRHPARRKLTKRQKPESSKEKSVEASSARSQGFPDTSSEVGPQDLSLVPDNYGNGPSLTTLTLTEGNLTEGYVIDILSPWLFWLQPTSRKLEKMMKDLNHYEDLLKPGSVAAMPPSNLKAGTVVCAQYSHDMHWYRGLVVSVQKIGHEKQMEVIYLDYGNREILPSSQIRPLMPEFAQLPCQAFPVGLSEIAPPDGSSEWRDETMSFMTSLSGTRVSAYCKRMQDCPVVLAEVLKPTSSRARTVTDHFSLAQRLIENRLAIHASNDRIVQFYSMMAHTDEQKGLDQTMLTRMYETDLLLAACPEIKPQKKKILDTAETGNTLASKMKGSDKSDKSANVGGDSKDQRPETKRGNSPDEELLLDDDLESVLDMELGRRSDIQEDNASNKRDHPVRTEGSEEKRSDSMPEKSGTKLTSQHWASWNVEKTVDDKKANANDGANPETVAATEPQVAQAPVVKGRSRMRKALRRTPKNDDKPADVTQLSSSSGGPSESNIGDTRGVKMPSESQVTEETLSKQVVSKDVVPPGLLPPVKQSSYDTKSPVKQSSKDTKSPVQKSSYDAKSASQVVGKTGEGDNSTDVKKTKHKRLDALEMGKDDSDKAPSSPEADISDARSDASNNSGLVKDDSSSDSAPASPENKILSWFEFLNTKIEGYPAVEVQAPEDGFILCLLSEIVSPSEFYVHLALEGCALAVDKLFQEVNDYFKENNVVALQKFFEPVLYDRCVARYKKDDMLYRAKILKVGDGVIPTKFLVFFVDYGNYAWVDKDDVYPLPPKFTTIPPLAVRCFLPEVKPKKGCTPANEHSCGWPQEAIDQFGFLTGYETRLQLHVLLFHGEVIRVREDDPLGVKLANTEGDEDLWIAHELVNGGFADPTDLFGISNQSLSAYQTSDDTLQVNLKNMVLDSGIEEQKSLDNWKPMEEDFTSIRNSYKVDIEDPGVAIMGYTPQDERNVCKYFDTGKPCPRGDLCPYLHVKTEGVMTTDKVEVFGVSDGENAMAAPEVGSCVVAEVTAVYSPSHFYVSFPYGPKPVADVLDNTSLDEGYPDSYDGETFVNLRDSMNEHYRKIRFRDIDMTVLADGEIVSAKYLADGMWYRARILETEPEKYKVKVFYLDFGNSEWLDERDTRQMLNRFMHLPFQAMECHMALEPLDEKWNDEAVDYFHDLVDGKDFYAEVKEKYGNSVLTIELWDTVDKNGNIADMLVEKKIARRPAKKIGQKPDKTKKDKKTSSAKICNYMPG